MGRGGKTRMEKKKEKEKDICVTALFHRQNHSPAGSLYVCTYVEY